MKVDFVRTFISICIGALIGWGFYAFANSETDSLPLGLVVGAEMALLGIGLLGISFNEYPRSGVMCRATCVLGIVVLLAMNSIFAYKGINNLFYILNGITSLLLLLTVDGVYRSKQ